MNVNVTSWHFRWYRHWQQWKRRTDVTYNWLLQSKEEPQLDLCHYFWIIVLFAPWRWFWQSSYRWDFLRPSVVTAALVAIGGISFASVTIPYVVLLVLGIIALAAVIATVVTGMSFLLSEYRWHEPVGRAIAKPFKAEHPKAHLFWEYAKAKKRRACPLITVTENDAGGAASDDQDEIEMEYKWLT